VDGSWRASLAGTDADRVRGIVKLEFDLEHGRRWLPNPEHGLVARFRIGYVLHVVA